MKIKFFVLAVLCLALIIVPVKGIINAEEEEIQLTEDDAIGCYIEDEKIDSQMVLQDFYPIDHTLTYSQTENIVPLAYIGRNDPYGTYDVYVDTDGTEFQYLTNTTKLCGFINYDFEGFIPQEDAITESECIEAMEDFVEDKLLINSNVFQNYDLSSLEYRELDGIYVAEYNRYVSGFKTDDVLCIWTAADGEVVSFSEFNRDRYDNLTISATDYNTASAAIDYNLNESSRSFEIVDEYVSKDWLGVIKLVKVVDFTDNTEGFIQRELISEPLN
ncbi:MAG: hypothetical protein IKQ36_00960 [Clostridia bacterium]|nr:hypothetical protein [Clostridia bacterium]